MPRRRTIVSSLLLMVFLATFPSGLLARPQSPQNSATTTTHAQQDSSVSSSSAQEQLSEMRRLDDRLLSAVLWSLGVVVFVAVLLAGFSWYTNFKIYERDRTNLRGELQISIEKELVQGRKDLESKLDQHREILNATSKKHLDQLASSLDQLKESLTSEMEGLRDRSTRELKEHEYELLGLQIRLEALDQTVPSNRARTLISLLELAVEFKRDWVYVDTLKKLSKLLEEGATISSSQVPRLNSILKGIPEDFSGLVDNLRSLIRTHTSAF